MEYTPIYMYNFYTAKSAHKFKIMDIEQEISKYEVGDTAPVAGGSDSDT